MARICIITQTHLAHNPRVVKEANTLQANGYDVVVLTVFSSRKALETDERLNRTGFQYEAAVNLITGKKRSLRPLLYRIRRKAGIKGFEYFRISTPHSLMYGPYEMLEKAIACKADLYIGHTEVGLWVCNQLAVAGYQVAYDFEDWYSQDYLNKRRPSRYLQKLENYALTVGKYATCPSLAMAVAIAKTYQQQDLEVIYNGFSRLESDQLKQGAAVIESVERISFIWFSQTIGPGRGLELIIEALNSIEFEYEFHLRGKCTEAYKQLLTRLHQPKQGQELFVHSPVAHQELLALVSKNDVGLALELDFPPSRNFTITNKILQYLQAGLMVISSETEGQKEVAGLCRRNVLLFKQNDVGDLAKALLKANELFQNKGIDRAHSIAAYQTHFSWETQEKKLLTLVAKALGK